MKYLLDTNTWIDYLRRGPNSNVTAKLLATSKSDIFLCSVVLAELWYGAHRGSPANLSNNLALIANLKQLFVSIPFDDRAAEECGKIRALLASAGTPIGPNDLLVASIGLSHGLTIVTHNITEFSRVTGFQVVDWK